MLILDKQNEFKSRNRLKLVRDITKQPFFFFVVVGPYLLSLIRRAF